MCLVKNVGHPVYVQSPPAAASGSSIAMVKKWATPEISISHFLTLAKRVLVFIITVTYREREREREKEREKERERDRERERAREREGERERERKREKEGKSGDHGKKYIVCKWPL
jgi:flagellar biosynthesis/type III secretory pathway M-ring protein FliF/YscJ